MKNKKAWTITGDVEADKYIKQHWPKNVSFTCHIIEERIGKIDCIELGVLPSEWCESCKTFDKLSIESIKKQLQ